MTKAAEATKETTKPVVKSEVADLAELIRKDIKLDHTSGVATVSADLYVKTLPEGLSKEVVQQVQQHNSLFAAAGLLALGEESIATMKKHKGLDKTSLEVGATGKDSFSFQFARSKEVRDVSSGETSTKFGAGSVGFNMYGVGSRGEVKKVKNLLAERAAEALGS